MQNVTRLYQDRLPAFAPPNRTQRLIMPRKTVDAILLLMLAAGLLFLSACTAGSTASTAAAPRPDTVVYQAKAAYEVALTGMVAYAKLPRCAPAAPTLCSSQPLLDQMERARTAARVTLDAAEGAVRTPGFGTDGIATAVAAAEAATKALTSITTLLPVK